MNSKFTLASDTVFDKRKDNQLDSLMEDCLESNNLETMEMVLHSCKETYVNYNLYYGKMQKARKSEPGNLFKPAN